jgi:hypothetical protein
MFEISTIGSTAGRAHDTLVLQLAYPLAAILEKFPTNVEPYFGCEGGGDGNPLCPMPPIDTSLKNRIVIMSRMNVLRGIILSILALGLVAVPATARAQVTSGERTPHFVDTPSRADAASLQKKAAQAQARIHANKDDRDQLMIAVKTNEVALAKQVLLRNGFTAEDLENAKITLRTGGGKGGEDEIEISAVCCEPKEITIRRSLENFTK